VNSRGIAPQGSDASWIKRLLGGVVSFPDSYTDAMGTSNRVLRLGWLIAALAAATLLVGHYSNFFLLPRAHETLNANSERTPFTWASVVAAGVAATAAILQTDLRASRRRWLVLLAGLLAFLSLDDLIKVHENLGGLVERALGLSDLWVALIWPLLYLPLMAVTVILLVVLGRSCWMPINRTLLVAIAMLGLAVVLEAATWPWSTTDNLVHILEGGVEEAAEMTGWILIAVSLTASGIFDLLAPGANRVDVQPELDRQATDISD